MSTILKALRRLEEEKRSRQPTSLEQDVLARAGPAPAGPRPWALTLGIATGASLVVVLLLGAIFYVFPLAGQRASEEPPGAAAKSATSATSARVEPQPAPVPAPAPAPPAVAAAPQPPIELPPAARIPRVESPPSTAAVGPPPDAPAAAAAEPPVAPFSAAAPRPKPVAAVVPDAPSRPVDEPQPEPSELRSEPAPARVEPEPEPAAAVAAVDAPPAPVAPVVEKSPPRQVEAEVVEPRNTPSLRVTRTVWHPNPDRRQAVVELLGRPPLRLGEGDVVAGYTIVEIGLAGVEFERDGVVVERRVGAR